jgi:FG-GAP-like repeat
MSAFWRQVSYSSLIFCLCSLAWSQQFRQGQEGTGLSKSVIESHLQSKHPIIPKDPGQPVPGKYLLGRSAARSSQLQARIRATRGKVQAQPQASSGVLPGLQFRPFLPAGSMATSVVTGDFNKDGNMDFVVANGGTNDLWVYFGNGDGTFQLPQIIPLSQGLTPVYLATADLRGIGVLDLIVAEFDTSTVGVLLGNGDGTFGYEQEYSLPQPPGALVIDDFNHDGKLDIVAVMDTVNLDLASFPYIATLVGNGTGSFGAPILSNTEVSTADSIVSGDVNGDGLPDLLITGPGQENSQIFLNAGDGTFTPGQTLIENGPFNVELAGALGDVNGDGCLDATLADANGFVEFFTGDCTGNFNYAGPIPMGDSNAFVALADMNGDGHLDIVTSTIPAISSPFVDTAGNMICVAYGDGQGNFTSGRDYVGTGLSYSLAISDFNGDGHPDVVSVSPETDTATVYINDGSGGFGFPQGEWIGVPGQAIIDAPVSSPSFADLNGDGKPDVFLLDEGGNDEYVLTSMLNDGTGRFAAPLSTDTQVSVISQWMGDYRLGDFRNSGHLDFVGIGLSTEYSGGVQYIVFAPGNGDGTFGSAVVTSTSGADGEMAVGDFNGDGKLDFVAVGPNSTLTAKVLNTFLGNGDGTFRSGASLTFADTATDISRVFVGDFNRDGKLDILVYTTSNGYWTTNTSVWEFLGNGDGTFQSGKQLFTPFQPMTLADVNNDSWLDIVRYNFMWPDGTTESPGPPTFTTYLGKPSGAFGKSSSYAPYSGVPEQAKPYLQFGDPMTSSKVADLNGDGNLDEIAFQQVSSLDLDVYAQVLMGNGDGTFTPTYDIFDFQKQLSFPGYAYHFDGTSFSDLMELDGATSSMHLFKGGAAPSLQLSLEEAQVSGTSGCGWVFLNVPSTSDTSVALSSSVSGVTLPATVTVPAGSLSEQFCYTLASGYNWRQVYDIRAQLGTDTAVAYASQSYVFGFSEAISPSGDQAIYPTQSSAPITVSLTSSQGYTSTVQLSCEGLIAGETCVFGSTTLDVSPSAVASTTVVVNTTGSTSGGGPITIVASDGNVSKQQSFNLTVQPLIVDSLGEQPQSASPGTGTGGIEILGFPPYHPSCSGLPAGITCTFSGDQLLYPSDTDLSVTLTVPSGIASGTYPFTVNVESGPASASVGLTLTIIGFTLQAPTNGTDWVPPGGAVNVNLSAQSNNYNGIITVTCSLSSAGSCTGGTFDLEGSTTTPLTLSLSVPTGISTGAQTLTVTATSNGGTAITQTGSFPFYIADYSGSLSESALTIARGGSGSLTASVSGTTGFDGSVSFSCAGTTQITCSFSPSSVQLTANNPQTTSLTLTASESASIRHGSDEVRRRPFILALVLPFAMVVLARKRQSGRLLALMGLALLVGILASLSCGGGGGNGGGGGGGSTTYSLTVNAAATGTSTQRTLGTISLTVTH